MTIMYIHGYGSDGNALKGRTLRRMLPNHRVVSPTFDYDHCPPQQIQQQIQQAVEENDVRLIVGSSLGGYHSLCATRFFHGTVWVLNPVHDVVDTMRRISPDRGVEGIKLYSPFDRATFQRQVALNQSGRWPDDTPLHFALSTDDELLGDHNGLLALFPDHRQVVWKDRCGHRFLSFEELADDIIASLPE